LLDIRDGVVSNVSLSTIEGDGRIVQTGGVLSIRQGETTANAWVFNTDIEISGGELICGDRTYVGALGVPTEFKVVGRGATISIYLLLQRSYAGNSGTFRFVLDEGGVSPINIGQYMHLEDAAIRVDGANFDPFTGSQTNIVLFESNNLQTHSTDMVYSNFHASATLEFVHNDDTDDLYLSYTPPPTGTVISVK